MAVVPLAPMCNRRSVNCSSATNAFSCRGSSETTRRYCAAAASNFPLRCSARPSWKEAPGRWGSRSTRRVQTSTASSNRRSRKRRRPKPPNAADLVRLARQQFAIGALGGIDAAGPVVALCVPNRPIPDVEGFAQKARERRYGLPSRWPNPLEPSHWCCLGTAGSQVNCANIFGGQSAGAIEWRASHQAHRPLARRGRHRDRPDHYPQFSSGHAEQGSR